MVKEVKGIKRSLLYTILILRIILLPVWPFRMSSFVMGLQIRHFIIKTRRYEQALSYRIHCAG